MQIRSKSEELWPVFPRVETELAAWDMEMEIRLKLHSSISWKHLERRKKKFDYKGKDSEENSWNWETNPEQNLKVKGN